MSANDDALKAANAMVVGFFGALLLIPLLLALGCYTFWATGYVMSRIWVWHVVPFGFSAYPPSFFGAVALLVVLAKGTRYSANRKLSTAESAGVVIGFLAAPWMALLTAWMFS